MKTHVNYSDFISLYKHDKILIEAICMIKRDMMCHISVCGVASS